MALRAVDNLTDEQEILPPHDDAAESALLGAVLKDSRYLANLTLSQSSFYDRRRGMVYAAMRALFDRMEPISYVTLQDELRRRKFPGDPLRFLSDIEIESPAIYAEQYAAIVERTHTLRRLIDVAQKIAGRAYEPDADPATILSHADSLLQACQPSSHASDLLTPEEWADTTLDDLQGRMEGTRTSVSTPWHEINAMTSGLEAGRLYLLLATPGSAKSEVALQMAMHAGATHGPVLLVSLEMMAVELAQRWIRIDRGVDRNALASGSMDDETLGNVTDAIGQMAQGNVYPVCPTTSYTTASVRAHARRMQAHTGKRPAMIVVDYIQLLDDRDGPDSSSWENIDAVAKGLKKVAREFGCPVVAPAQPSRDYKGRISKQPVLTDLRGGSGLEAAADVVLGLYRPALHEERGDPSELRWYMLKNRSGSGDSVPSTRSLRWLSSKQRYVDPTRSWEV